MDWIKHIPFINRKYRDTRLNNAKNVPWGNQDLKTNIPNSPSTQQLRDVYKQRVRQNIRYGTPSDPAFPWQERTRMPTNKPTPPKGIPNRVSPKQLKGLINDLKAAKPPMVLKIPLPKGITIPKIPISLPPGLVKAAGVGGSIYQLASEAPRTWRALESSGVDIWSIITSGAGLVPQISSQPWWQDFAKAIVERKRELQQQQGLIRPSSTTEVQPATYPFTGGQIVGIYYYVDWTWVLSDGRKIPRSQTNSMQFPIRGRITSVAVALPISGSNPAVTIVSTLDGTLTGSHWSGPQGYNDTRKLATSIADVRVYRTDGQPDTGGNPLPTSEPILSEPWIPVPVTPIPVSDLIPEPTTEPTTTTTEEEQKPLSPSPFGGIPFVPTMLPIPNEGVNEGLAPSQTPLTPNSPSVDDQTAPTVIKSTDPFVKRSTYVPLTEEEERKVASWFPAPFPIELQSEVENREAKQFPSTTTTPTQTPQKEEEKKPVPGAIPSFLPLFTPVRDGSKPSNEIAPKTTESVKQTPQPSNCELNNSCTLNKIADLEKQNQARQNTLLDKVDFGAQLGDLVLLKVIDNKLGNQLPNGISGYFKAAWEATKMDKIINLLTLIAAAHNAAMLSRNLGQTLGDAASQVLQVFGIKDHEKNPIDVNEVIGKSIDNAFKSLLGEEVWTGAKTTWNKANRIISSASQIIWSIRSIADSTREIMEWTAENTGKIGNALKRFRVVGENAYKWMPERVTTTNAWMRKIERVRDGTDSLDDAASSFSSVLSEVQNVQEEFGQLNEQKKQFDKNLKEFTPKEREDNEPVKTKVLEGKDASKAPSGTENVFRGEGEQS